jgi:hypothetical protein
MEVTKRKTEKSPGLDYFFVNVNYQQCPYAETINGFRGEGTYALIHSMKDEPDSVGSPQLLTHGI